MSAESVEQVIEHFFVAVGWMHGPGVVMRYKRQEHLIVGDRVSRRRHLLHVTIPR